VASRKDRRRNGKHRESERYREAAELALSQLAWCIECRIGKRSIARRLEQNLKTIVERYHL
jgi:hypothetical protein